MDTKPRAPKDIIIIDVGLKTEGRIPIKEFALEDKQPAPGDIVVVTYPTGPSTSIAPASPARPPDSRKQNTIIRSRENPATARNWRCTRSVSRRSSGVHCRAARGAATRAHRNPRRAIARRDEGLARIDAREALEQGRARGGRAGNQPSGLHRA